MTGRILPVLLAAATALGAGQAGNEPVQVVLRISNLENAEQGKALDEALSDLKGVRKVELRVETAQAILTLKSRGKVKLSEIRKAIDDANGEREPRMEINEGYTRVLGMVELIANLRKNAGKVEEALEKLENCESARRRTAGNDRIEFTCRHGRGVSLKAILKTLKPFEPGEEPDVQWGFPAPVSKFASKPVKTNMIVNGDFEGGESGRFKGAGKGWESNDNQSHPGSHTLDDKVKHKGKYSQRIETNEKWDHWPLRQVTGYNTIEPGKRYRITAYVKVKDNNNPHAWYTVGVCWFDGDREVYTDKNPIPALYEPEHDWKKIEFEAVAPPKANRAGVLLTAHYPGIAWYDDVVFGPLE